MPADMHVEGRGRRAKNVVVDAVISRPPSSSLVITGVISVFEKHEIAHHHRLAPHRRKRDPAAQRQGRFDRPHRQASPSGRIAAGRNDAHRPTPPPISRASVNLLPIDVGGLRERRHGYRREQHHECKFLFIFSFLVLLRPNSRFQSSDLTSIFSNHVMLSDLVQRRPVPRGEGTVIRGEKFPAVKEMAKRSPFATMPSACQLARTLLCSRPRAFPDCRRPRGKTRTLSSSALARTT